MEHVSFLGKVRTIWCYRRYLCLMPKFWRAIMDCPYGEPLHYHHDGCPACFGAWLEDAE